MKNYILPIFLICALLMPAQAKQNTKQNPVLNTLEQELKREFKQLKKAKPPVYFLSYQITEIDNLYLGATLGNINYEKTTNEAYLDVDVRVGSPELDNTRKIKLIDMDRLSNNTNKNPFLIKVSLTNESALKNSIWLTTDLATKAAQEQYLKVLNNTKTAATRFDSSADFSKAPKKPAQYIEDMPEVKINIPELKSELANLSALMKGYDFIYASNVDFYLVKETNYFVNSEGAKIKEPRILIRLNYQINSRNKDGMQLSRTNSYDGISLQDLPGEEKIKRDILKSIEELKQLQNAPSADTFHGPVILKNRAAGVFFHEILGHRVEGHRQKDDDFGQTFTQKVGEQIVAPIITVYDNPTMTHFKGTPLRGHYLYDDEGTPAQKAMMIENGVLKGFLMGRSPIKNFPNSNGHGRKSYGRKVVSRMGVTVVEAQNQIPYTELVKKLKEEIKRQNKPYGLIIDDISGGFTNTDTYSPQSFKVQPLLVYKVFPDDRPNELIRGADIVGTPLTSFNKITAVADDNALFNGTCGAESGWVPVSAIAPSLLISELEVEKVNKTYENLPILPPPSVENKSKKEVK